jgi:hypothetical protein
MSAQRDMKKIFILSLALITLFFYTPPSYCEEETVEEEAEINYNTVFETDIGENHDILWTVFEDEEQDATKLLKERNIRAIFTGRYDDFAGKFSEYAYTRLSLYRSPFQVKIFFIDYYLNKLIDMKILDKPDKIYLTIHNFKKEYVDVYPHVYKKRSRFRKTAIIPNKLFFIDFFEDERFLDIYQSLFDSVTEAVLIKDVKTVKLLPQILDKSKNLKLTEKSRFNFYKASAVVDEVLIKKSLETFFGEIKEFIDVIDITELYNTKYLPRMEEDFTPLSERIISVNVLYDPDSDFDYYEMDYAKKGALLHKYFIQEGLSLGKGGSVKGREHPAEEKEADGLIEVQKLYNMSLYPQEDLYEFEYDSDRGYYYRAVEDFYDNLDDAMQITEDVITSYEFNVEVLKLKATVDEIELLNLMKELKEEIKEFARSDDKTKKH